MAYTPRSLPSRARPSSVVLDVLEDVVSAAEDEATFDLADVDERVERGASILQQIDAAHDVLTRERVDLDLNDGGAVAVVVEAAVARRGVGETSGGERNAGATSGAHNGGPRRVLGLRGADRGEALVELVARVHHGERAQLGGDGAAGDIRHGAQVTRRRGQALHLAGLDVGG